MTNPIAESIRRSHQSPSYQAAMRELFEELICRRLTEAERVKAWRDAKRGGPPRPYDKSQIYLSPYLHQIARAKEKKVYQRAMAIRQAWDDPLRRAVMSRIKTK